MDKIQFNNEIVMMRKTVKRVKVQIINNLTRQAKHLQNKKGSEEQLGKNKKRSERLLEEVQAIKDWPSDEITFSTITQVNSSEESNLTCSSTPRERALCRLSRHKLIQKQIATFNDSLTPDLLNAVKYRKKVTRKKVVKEKADSGPIETAGPWDESHRGGHDGTERGYMDWEPPNRKLRRRQMKLAARDEPDEPEAASSESDEDDAEPFFMTSKKEETLEGTAKSTPMDGRLEASPIRPHKSESNSVRVADDSEASVSPRRETPDSGDGHNVDGDGDRRRVGPAVDVPYQIKRRKEAAEKFIPGISQPVEADPPRTTDPATKEGALAADRGPGRFEPNGRGLQRTNHRQDRNRSFAGINRNVSRRDEPKHESKKVSGARAPVDVPDDSEKLHPSWAAKKAQRGREATRFEGKRITFDEN